MAAQMSEHRDDSAPGYDNGVAEAIALLGAVLLGVAITALFVFITWLAYATS